MDLDLVGYSLNLLEPAERERIEAALQDDPAARKQLARLRAHLASLANAGDDEPAPYGLADRTIDRVAIQMVLDRPTPLDREPVFTPSRWRRLDAAVSAAIVLIIVGLGSSGLGRVHQRYEKLQCQNNLRQMHQSFVSYSADHGGRFPQVGERPPNNVAAAFVPMLQQAGHLPANGAPICPVVVVTQAPTGGYAYSLGFRGPDGRLHGLQRGPSADADLLPILADRPAPIGHRTGFNVLFIGGNVRFCTSPKVGVDGDDIFLNQADTVAAGLHRLDSVLADGNSQP